MNINPYRHSKRTHTNEKRQQIRNRIKLIQSPHHNAMIIFETLNIRNENTIQKRSNKSRVVIHDLYSKTDAQRMTKMAAITHTHTQNTHKRENKNTPFARRTLCRQVNTCSPDFGREVKKDSPVLAPKQWVGFSRKEERNVKLKTESVVSETCQNEDV